MPDTNEYITKLMNRNDDYLDDILSFADNIRSHVAMKNESKRADDILDEILSDSHDISAENPVKNEIHSVEVNTENNETRTVFTQVLPVVHNYHHVLINPEQFRYVPQQNKKPEIEYACTRNAIISDEPAQEEKNVITIQQKKEEKPQKQHDQNDDISEKSDKHKHTVFDDIDESDPYNAKEFINIQAMKHPRFYLIVGISIFFLTILGLGSCIYLGLSALRKFCETYN